MDVDVNWVGHGKGGKNDGGRWNDGKAKGKKGDKTRGGKADGKDSKNKNGKKGDKYADGKQREGKASDTSGKGPKCWTCGGVGHRSNQCPSASQVGAVGGTGGSAPPAVSSAATGSAQASSSSQPGGGGGPKKEGGTVGLLDEDEWILVIGVPSYQEMISQVRPGEVPLILDSGAVRHVAPPWFAESVPLRPPPPGLTLRTADGTPIVIRGTRDVRLQFEGHPGIAKVRFVICEGMTYTILSVPLLAEHGHRVTFGNGICEVETPRGKITGSKVGGLYEIGGIIIADAAPGDLLAPVAEPAAAASSSVAEAVPRSLEAEWVQADEANQLPEGMAVEKRTSTSRRVSTTVERTTRSIRRS